MAAPAYKATMRRVQKVLTPELRNADWAGKAVEDANPLFGLCYVASEALYYLLGGKEAGWTPNVLSHDSWPQVLGEGETHWFLRHESGAIADPTAAQFKGKPIPYEQGRGNGFLTKQPSKRASIVIERVENQQEQSIKQAAAR